MRMASPILHTGLSPQILSGGNDTNPTLSLLGLDDAGERAFGALSLCFVSGGTCDAPPIVVRYLVSTHPPRKPNLETRRGVGIVELPLPGVMVSYSTMGRMAIGQGEKSDEWTKGGERGLRQVTRRIGVHSVREGAS